MPWLPGRWSNGCWQMNSTAIHLQTVFHNDQEDIDVGYPQKIAKMEIEEATWNLARKLIAGGYWGQILHVEHVSIVLLEHQPVSLPEKEAAPSKPIPTILPTWRFSSLIHLTSAKYMRSTYAFFKGTMSKKYSTGVPSSSQQQKTDNFCTAVISVH